jgi:hypothetical protein
MPVIEKAAPEFKVGDRVRLTYNIRHIDPATREIIDFYPTGEECVVEDVRIHVGKLYEVVWYGLRMADGKLMVLAEGCSQLEAV